MSALFIPVTANNFKFLQVYHPEPIRYSTSDDLGLILCGVIKHHCNYRRGVRDIFKREDYPDEISLNFNQRESLRNQKITLRSVKIVNNKISRIIDNELHLYIKIELLKNPLSRIRDLIDEFINMYSLSVSTKEFATLERTERRKREKSGELLYKRKIINHGITKEGQYC